MQMWAKNILLFYEETFYFIVYYNMLINLGNIHVTLYQLLYFIMGFYFMHTFFLKHFRFLQHEVWNGIIRIYFHDTFLWRDKRYFFHLSISYISFKNSRGLVDGIPRNSHC